MPLRPETRRVSNFAIGLLAGAFALSGCAQFDHVSTMVETDAPTTPKAIPSETATPSPTPTVSETATPSPEASAAVSAEARPIDVYSLRVGDCFNEIVSTGDIVEEVGLIDCAASHEYELYAQVDLPEGTTLETLYDVSDELCHTAFQEFTGAPWESSDYSYSYFTPSDESLLAGESMWVDCMIYHEIDLLEGSLRDSGYADWADPNADA